MIARLQSTHPPPAKTGVNLYFFLDTVLVLTNLPLDWPTMIPIKVRTLVMTAGGESCQVQGERKYTLFEGRVWIGDFLMIFIDSQDRLNSVIW